MKIPTKTLVQDMTILLNRCGVGIISILPPAKAHIGKFEIQVPLHTSKSFLLELYALASSSSLPAPQISGFRPGKTVNEDTGYIEAYYLYNKENVIRIMNALSAAFQDGRPEGFLAKALEKSAWGWRP